MDDNERCGDCGHLMDTECGCTHQCRPETVDEAAFRHDEAMFGPQGSA